MITIYLVLPAFRDNLLAHSIAQSTIMNYTIMYRDLNTFSDWFKVNKLSLNANKANYVILKNIKIHNNSKIIKIGSEIIQQASTATFWV